MNTLTYTIGVGPSAFRGEKKMASLFSSPVSLNSFVAAGWLKYTEGLKPSQALQVLRATPAPIQRQKYFANRSKKKIKN